MTCPAHGDDGCPCDPDPPVVYVAVEPHCVDVETGLWCDRCALPSGCDATIALVNPSTLRIIATTRHVWCTDCGALLAPERGDGAAPE